MFYRLKDNYLTLSRSLLSCSIRVLSQSIFYISSVFIIFSSNIASAEQPSFWEALRFPGHVALIRHAIAPGFSDPASFSLEDCRTQRNLSKEGRDQAKRIGLRFRSNGFAKARIYTSQWCRCRDTANLLGLGQAKELPILNSFFENFENKDKQTRALKGWLADQVLDKPLILVTHQVNITALTGIYPDSGEAVIIHRSNNGEISVIGSLKTD